MSVFASHTSRVPFHRSPAAASRSCCVHFPLSRSPLLHAAATYLWSRVPVLLFCPFTWRIQFPQPSRALFILVRVDVSDVANARQTRRTSSVCKRSFTTSIKMLRMCNLTKLGVVLCCVVGNQAGAFSPFLLRCFSPKQCIIACARRSRQLPFCIFSRSSYPPILYLFRPLRSCLVAVATSITELFTP